MVNKTLTFEVDPEKIATINFVNLVLFNLCRNFPSKSLPNNNIQLNVFKLVRYSDFIFNKLDQFAVVI